MKKTIKYIATAIVAICLCFYLYIRIGAYFLIDEQLRSKIVSEIKRAPELPEQFYDLYELTYPNSLNKGNLTCFIERVAFSNYSSQSPFLSTAYKAPLHGIQTYMLAFYLEDNTTHKQCLNFEADYIDFLYNNIGITSASQYYFQKELSNLDDKEMLTLIIMMSNPSYYNPIRRPDKVEERVNSVLKRPENKKRATI